MKFRNRKTRYSRQGTLREKYWWRGMAKTNYRKLNKKARQSFELGLGTSDGVTQRKDK